MTPRKRSRGWTTLDLLVCSGLLVVLLALFFPTVVSARAQARENQCKNNLKQIGLALHNYHDTFNGFAPGWITSDRTAPDGRGYGWIISLLPFMDQVPLYNQLDFNDRFPVQPGKQLAAALKSPIPMLRCPADGTPNTNPFRDNWGTSNYSGNAGHRPLPIWSGAPRLKNWPGQVVAESDKPNWQWNSGIFAPNSIVKVRDITDGTSNTIMVGERSATSAAGIWSGITANTHLNDILTDGSHASPINKSLRSFSAMHRFPHFLFCDGTVRAIKPDLESLPNSDPQMKLGIFQNLCSRNDGQPVGEF